MKCVICRNGETQPGKTTVTLERERLTLVFKGVPAEVCENCGEAYVSAEISRQLLAAGVSSKPGFGVVGWKAGVQVEVREFAATPA